ncbi:hypothetical protein ACLOJK_028422 [Asimina triloba]
MPIASDAYAPAREPLPRIELDAREPLSTIPDACDDWLLLASTAVRPIQAVHHLCPCCPTPMSLPDHVFTIANLASEPLPKLAACMHYTARHCNSPQTRRRCRHGRVTFTANHGDDRRRMRMICSRRSYSACTAFYSVVPAPAARHRGPSDRRTGGRALHLTRKADC